MALLLRMPFLFRASSHPPVACRFALVPLFPRERPLHLCLKDNPSDCKKVIEKTSAKCASNRWVLIKARRFLQADRVAAYCLRNTKLPTEYPAPKEQITPISPFFKSLF